MQLYADVILPIPLQRLFTYSVPEDASHALEKGMRVAVPFGKSKIYTGLVYAIHNQSPTAYKAKDIDQLLDDAPLVREKQLKHWEWVARYYMCTLGEVFRTAVPSAFLLESETIICRNSEAEVAEEGLRDDEFLVYEALQFQPELKVQQVAAIVERKQVLQLLNRLIQKKVIVLKERLSEQYKPKLVRYLGLGEAYKDESNLEILLETLSRAQKQRQAVMGLFQLQAGKKQLVPEKLLLKESGVSKAVIRSLIDKGVLQLNLIKEDRVAQVDSATDPTLIKLNQHQEEALQQVQEALENKKVCLLHGVTSSGKTEVYIRLMEQYLSRGRQVLYLVPEIALTTQLIDRLQEYFGEQITVYHSRYNARERVEAWNNVLREAPKARLVVGARSALFLPFNSLGLIVVDEEHEGSFKQFDPAPRYHARDAAVVLAQLHTAHILLGSATPSLESYNNVSREKYGYAHIGRRFGDVLMPDIELVDLKEAHRKKKMKGHFSARLAEAIAEALEEGEQVILFQNRRGYAPIMECQSCGHCPQCPNCDVSLVFHRNNRQLRCHYCGFQQQQPESCPACGNFTLDTRGYGTEQVAEEVRELFPGSRVGRMDLDTTRGKNAHAKIIQSFEQQEFDILVGTQMVTKGLDFRNVSLVGIMNADSLLNFPDFRAHERSFQLLTQVAGRAGRTRKRGKVLIQTFNPYHRILQQVSEGDYLGMYREQLYEREQFKYPPYNRIIKITLKHKNFQTATEAAEWFATGLRNLFGKAVLGPEFPPVARIRNQYLKNILLKVPREWSPSKTKNSIKRIEQSFNAISQFRSVRVIYNVDYF